MKELSVRLKTIASLVLFDTRVCDIGTDHGYLAIHLIENGIASHVIAADIGEKPLK
ncbi:MAG: tRNA (adenine(22)-N(1))-methyltransferase TrmK, partial [Clostridia bacterium]|nr:tRNA (adenine(22)-N(1))-methyltransferase TrmK [Clostridia bacterium]